MSQTHTKARAERVMDDTAASVGTLAGDAMAHVEDFAHHATATAERAYGQARKQVHSTADTITASVEQRPLAALVVAGLVCGAVGFLLGRR